VRSTWTHILALSLSACLGEPLEVREAPRAEPDPSDPPAEPDPSDPPAEPDPSDPPAETDPSEEPSTLPPDEGRCLPDMVEVDGRFCVDVAEATLEEQVDGAWVPASPFLTVGDRVVRAASGLGRVPQGYISGDEAAAACEAAGKRLCTSAEWLAACQGPDDHTWPYGPTYDASACNDSYGGGHPVIDLFNSQDVWDSAHMNDPRINQQPGTLIEGGSAPACVSAWGAWDMHGNLHEWVSDAEGTFRGGFYADARINGPGCTYTTTAHTRTYHDYSTGFRCCAPVRDL
jgi:sulfatase modifying factor 1